MLVFEEWGKPEYLEKNLSDQGREPTTNSTHLQCKTPSSGIEPGPQWWEATALTTAPSLLPPININIERSIVLHVHTILLLAEFQTKDYRRADNNTNHREQ